jgi:hypothetical protein
VARHDFTTDGDAEYLGFDEAPIIVGKFHWLVWVNPLIATVSIGLLYLFQGRNPRVIVVAAVLTAIALKTGPLRTWNVLPVIFLVGAAVVIAERFDGYLVWLFGLSAVYTGYSWLDHRWTTFILTTGRIVRRSGILTTQTATMNVRALTDIRLDETIPGKFLRYGHFVVESAGQNQAFTDLRYVPDPEFFYQLVMTVASGRTPTPDRMRRLPPGWSYG